TSDRRNGPAEPAPDELRDPGPRPARLGLRVADLLGEALVVRLAVALLGLEIDQQVLQIGCHVRFDLSPWNNICASLVHRFVGTSESVVMTARYFGPPRAFISAPAALMADHDR